MRELLIAITCHNKLDYTKQAVESIQKAGFDNILVLDDNSTDDTCNYFSNRDDLIYIRQEDRSCLTGLWNKAYHYAKNSGYSKLIIANNDIIVPKFAIEELLWCMKISKADIVVPLSNGYGHRQNQDIRLYIPNYKPSDNYNDVQHIQNIVLSKTGQYIKDNINGFFMLFDMKFLNKSLLKDGNPFNLENKLYDGEDEIQKRANESNYGKFVVCLSSFIFHYKQVSIEEIYPNRLYLNQIYRKKK